MKIMTTKTSMQVVLLQCLILLLSFISSVEAFQNLIPKPFQALLPTTTINNIIFSDETNPLTFPNPFAANNNNNNSNNNNKKTGMIAAKLETDLLQAIQDLGSDNRLANSDTIDSLVEQLEAIPSIPRPAVAPQVYGRWRLLHTSNANTASPIQRKAVSSGKFPIFQDITVRRPNDDDDDDKGCLIVSQVVQFSDTAQLKVDALASTSAYPLPELTERKGDGKIAGLNLLGVSLVGDEAQEDPNRPDSRINFVFDEGNFDFQGRKIPYPVPFRLPLLRDTVKGWIDITYLSDNIRISRGNKGTTFILQKEEEEL
ncbi:plastid lipid-associated PAP/fibrillin family protein [Nitzschia inconspicua]|uniref:Plastid lipid-associated PAP/fibrillin family protein n=1 Tax=Nitzschia inconspicua TaxID=303405 RepID=A0A9K3P9M0_9STRA|nr:plastid lipid-associated PAP/fibrillin family protein [Nitzschia inconspicua]KAG7343684.1 plastid lipid-associated PAP/fibrillin family protein [Nitzschia inconspicua]